MEPGANFSARLPFPLCASRQSGHFQNDDGITGNSLILSSPSSPPTEKRFWASVTA